VLRRGEQLVGRSLPEDRDSPGGPDCRVGRLAAVEATVGPLANELRGGKRLSREARGHIDVRDVEIADARHWTADPRHGLIATSVRGRPGLGERPERRIGDR
jgi:hypothetical protein